jgi:Ni,Fe-hydrogenase I large subunit
VDYKIDMALDWLSYAQEIVPDGSARQAVLKAMDLLLEFQKEYKANVKRLRKVIYDNGWWSPVMTEFEKGDEGEK